MKKAERKLARLQRDQDKLTVDAAVGDLSITGLLRAYRNPRPEVSAAAERLLECVRPKKGQPKVVPPPSVPVAESVPVADIERSMPRLIAGDAKIEENTVYAYRKYDPKIGTYQHWWDRTKQWKSVYHESGHVWVAARSWWPVKRVTVDAQVHKNPEGNGLTQLHFFPAPPPELFLNYVMAGKVCERLVLPRGLWGLSEMGGYYNDVEVAYDYLKSVCGVTSRRQQDKMLREAEEQVQALVAQPVLRNEIDRIAEALIEFQTLSGPQVRSILGLDLFWEQSLFRQAHRDDEYGNT